MCGLCVLALLAYVGLNQLDGVLAMPLRECSARLSELILNCLSFPVDRSGVIPSTGLPR